ncbi:MAG TPA: hypothetical protein VGC66_07390 [Pyrinomonadaceae bacterium]
MIDVKDAVKRASEDLVNLLGRDAVSNIQLEEVELVKEGDWMTGQTPDEAKPEVEAEAWDETYWLITLSYLPANPNPLLSPERQRQYKIFKIDANSGELRAMKIRKVA